MERRRSAPWCRRRNTSGSRRSTPTSSKRTWTVCGRNPRRNRRDSAHAAAARVDDVEIQPGRMRWTKQVDLYASCVRGRLSMQNQLVVANRSRRVDPRPRGFVHDEDLWTCCSRAPSVGPQALEVSSKEAADLQRSWDCSRCVRWPRLKSAAMRGCPSGACFVFEADAWRISCLHLSTNLRALRATFTSGWLRSRFTSVAIMVSSNVLWRMTRVERYRSASSSSSTRLASHSSTCLHLRTSSSL
mmetsp:Transcript_2649/g.9468  ORF Transcript_2649/g.9468 Transcript_2649/m.9468 type:complete len:244 (+) Transcript_2649:345-1076(+)